MTKEEIIDGLKFTMEMCLYNPTDGSMRPVSTLNDMDKTTYDACEGAIKLLEQPTVEMAEDCVKREDAQDIMARLLSDYLHDEDREKIENANAEIGELPSVYPQPVDCSEQGSPYCLGHCPYEPQPKRGKWIYTGDYFTEGMCKCSECGTEVDVSEARKFCFECGCRMDADMREVQDANNS